MTQPTGTFDKYSAIGIREDLADIIFNISPTDTPFQNNIGRATATATTHEWQTDSLAAADTTNAQIEGDDTAAATISPTTRVGNYTQISKKVIIISGTLEAVKKAGRKSEVAYQTAKKGKEIKRDMEAILTAQQVAVAGNSTTARKLAGFDAWLASNTSNGASGTNYTSSGGVPTGARTSGTARQITEALLKTVVASQYTNGGHVKMLMVPPLIKQTVSTFVGIADNRFNINGAKPGTIIGAADIYVSDFGNLEVTPNRFMPTGVAYSIDPEYASVAYLRPFFSEPLAKTGDSDKHHMVVEYTLQCNNEAAHGVLRDVTA